MPTPSIPPHATWRGTAPELPWASALERAYNASEPGELTLTLTSLVLGELRGAESVSFLRAINTGHPGSFSTVHANSLQGALEQLSLMVMQTGIGLTRKDIIAYAASVIDVMVQLGRGSDGKRGIAEIARSSDLLKSED